MEITGIVWETEDGCWCLEVGEKEYRRVMGDENWGIEKSLRRQFPDEKMPWTIQISDLLGELGGVMCGNEVRLNIEIEKLSNPE